jgi:hypothetical protein
MDELTIPVTSHWMPRNDEGDITYQDFIAGEAAE